MDILFVGNIDDQRLGGVSVLFPGLNLGFHTKVHPVLDELALGSGCNKEVLKAGEK